MGNRNIAKNLFPEINEHVTTITTKKKIVLHIQLPRSLFIWIKRESRESISHYNETRIMIL